MKRASISLCLNRDIGVVDFRRMSYLVCHAHVRVALGHLISLVCLGNLLLHGLRCRFLVDRLLLLAFGEHYSLSASRFLLASYQCIC